MNYFGNGFGPQYGAGMPQNNYGMQTPQRCVLAARLLEDLLRAGYTNSPTKKR